jgi:Co/Zn/Cd efflux system component
MDCPAEENLIRIKLNDIKQIVKLEFDLQNRKLLVYHNGNLVEISRLLNQLNLDAKLISTEEDVQITEEESKEHQRKILIIVLGINFLFFVIEIIFGILSNSMGLVADSLDMLADSLVYSISLYAVGAGVVRKKKVASIAGVLQLSLAIIGLIEVLRRFIGIDEIPDFEVMIIISFFAAIANGICLYLLQQSKSNQAHIRASMIFTSNDVIINIGVILAGTFVLLLNSQYPDLIIGLIVFLIVITGAFKILNLSK